MNNRTIAEVALVSIPLLSFYDSQIVHEHTSFIVIVLLLGAYFYLYPLEPLKNEKLEPIRKYSILLCGSWLTLLLIGEIELIICRVYQLEFSY